MTVPHRHAESGRLAKVLLDEELQHEAHETGRDVDCVDADGEPHRPAVPLGSVPLDADDLLKHVELAVRAKALAAELLETHEVAVAETVTVAVSLMALPRRPPNSPKLTG